MKKTTIFALVAAAFIAVSCGESAPPANEDEIADLVSGVIEHKGQDVLEQMLAQDIAPADIADKVASGQINVLDVRTPEEVAQGKLEGAVVINIHDADFNEQVGSLDKQAPWLVYCKAGGRSARAMGIMVELGFKQVYNLDGGITAWSNAGLEISVPNNPE